MEYVLVMRDERYWLVGPFASRVEAAEWGNATYYPEEGEDQCWRLITLKDARAPVMIVAPNAATPEMECESR